MKTMKMLKNDTNIVIVPADKCTVTVVMDKAEVMFKSVKNI